MIIYKPANPRSLSNEDLLDTLLWAAEFLKEHDVAPSRRRRYYALQYETLRRMKERKVNASED